MPYEEAFYIPPKNKSGHQSWVRKGEQRNRPRAPQPGQGSMRVTNGDEAIWLSSDPRSRKDPPVDHVARIRGLLDEAAKTPPPRRPAAPTPHPFASHAQSDDPNFGAPLFRRSQQPIADTRPPSGMEFGPGPAGPRREATPYSGLADRPRDYPGDDEGFDGIEEDMAPGQADKIAAMIGRLRQRADHGFGTAGGHNSLLGPKPTPYDRNRDPEARRELRGETPFQTGREDPLEQLRAQHRRKNSIPQGGYNPVPYAAPTSPTGADFLGEPPRPVSPLGEVELGPSQRDWREARMEEDYRKWDEAGSPNSFDYPGARGGGR